MVHKGKRMYLKKQDISQNLNSKPPKKAKIIVRNLPFKNLSEKSVENLFKEFGDIAEVKLLRKEDGRFLGCGFVQFKKVTSAAKAIRHANEKEISGRQIVVDWALPKKTFLEKIQKLKEGLNKNNVKQEVLSEDESSNLDFIIDKKPEKWYNANDSDTDEFEEKENEEGSMDNDHDNEVIKSEKKEFINPISKQKKQYISEVSDVDEGKTVFIRNIPYSASNEDLKMCFESYGPVEYALICIDKLTEHSKGTGFVKFKEKENACQCIKDSNKIYLHDNVLTITMAISKTNLESQKTSKKVVKDSRNLYLIREGMVIAGSKAAAGVSAGDMTKRLQLEQWKSQILKNLNMFVSKTRLVIHNLPPSYDDTKLRDLFEKHSTPTAIIKEAKVMYDNKKLDVTGKRVSKEVGFVSFTKHEDALFALRNINNNPSIITPQKRPIVAFSIENKAVINSKLKRLEKSRTKLSFSDGLPDKLLKLNRKQRRFMKRREKFIEMRKEAKKLKQNQSSEDAKVEKKKNHKRKRKNSMESEHIIKRKIDSVQSNEESKHNTFTGVISELKNSTKIRSKFRVKNQAKIHNQTLKKERRKKRETERKKMVRIKLPKEKKRHPRLIDDANLSKLLKKHRESIQKSFISKKWYDN